MEDEVILTYPEEINFRWIRTEWTRRGFIAIPVAYKVLKIVDSTMAGLLRKDFKHR